MPAPDREVAIFASSIRHCLRNLLCFSGRDSRALFWPYAFTLFCLTNIGGYYWMMFMMQRFMRAIVNHPGDPPVRLGPGGPLIHFAPGHPAEDPNFFQTIMVGAAIGIAIFIGLVAAAVWRRLHDRGSSGLWGLLPVGFIVISLSGMMRLFGEAPEGRTSPGVFLIVFCSNLAYFASGIALVIMLAREGTPGPNEFGPEPGAAETD